MSIYIHMCVVPDNWIYFSSRSNKVKQQWQAESLKSDNKKLRRQKLEWDYVGPTSRRGFRIHLNSASPTGMGNKMHIFRNL